METAKGIEMAKTGAERYFETRGKNAEHRDAYERARSAIDEVDRIVGAIEERRLALGLSKAELARRVGVAPESVRRLLSAEHANPTLSTVVSLTKVLDLDIIAVAKRKPRQIA
jgi:ribosome-binding protein aMBF1 (putative translation factor)